MTTWAIGDIQGCSGGFDALLEAICFDPAEDRLWIAGDLVNRGPDSPGVLRRLMALDDRATIVLGNHDLHLLAVVAGVRPPQEGDTFDEFLAAPDRDELVRWLRRRPLLHYDPELQTALVHAGVPPGWSLEEALGRAADVSAQLAGPDWLDGLRELYGDEPSAWSAGLGAADRRRFIINALTRMRYVDAAGRLDFEHHGTPGTQPPGLHPWYELCDVGDVGDVSDVSDVSDVGDVGDVGDVHIVFGHWASLGLATVSRDSSGKRSISRGRGLLNSSAPGPRFTCIDTGCVWGRSLTALPLDRPGEPVSVQCGDFKRPLRRE